MTYDKGLFQITHPLLFEKLVFKKSRLSEGSFHSELARVSLGYGRAHYDYYVDHMIYSKNEYTYIYIYIYTYIYFVCIPLLGGQAK